MIVFLWVILYCPRPARPRRRGESAGGPGGWASWLLRLAAIGFISIAGFIAFQLYLWQYYGRADAFLAVQKSWEARSAPPHRLVRLITLQQLIQPAFKPIKHAACGVGYLGSCTRGSPKSISAACSSRPVGTRRSIWPWS